MKPSRFRLIQMRVAPCRWVAVASLLFNVIAAQARGSHSPTIDVLGSYFPAWLLCFVVAIILTIFTRLLFTAWRLNVYLMPIFYPCLVVIFALGVWLIFFQN